MKFKLPKKLLDKNIIGTITVDQNRNSAKMSPSGVLVQPGRYKVTAPDNSVWNYLITDEDISNEEFTPLSKFDLDNPRDKSVAENILKNHYNLISTY